ncbi:unnamed protein product [Vitrella brassicaformis CCMP3155]|uniref:VTT domain-containing protein n=1 Tax=Vitrella brassicaformis (strain CCMP3155) TaxID=1169540 RepID=A0A0G4FJ66_VITBC|nr:unnamed protein product [Vitrella brassicaformis CCMP3155]|mmetsp:Transcript_22700/g.56010  ORF Transcript_22700/g.56010 Transcript_22700/m.56010 type:complete len:298 (-) Transcript_22700:1333-2226(-)|eukprot:CEM13091.1 unnamed protein product [Vitrella brassicaformis CCMP3155]
MEGSEAQPLTHPVGDRPSRRSCLLSRDAVPAIGICILIIGSIATVWSVGKKNIVNEAKVWFGGEDWQEHPLKNGTLATCIFTLGVVLCIPVSLMELAYGAFFRWWALVICLIGKTVGSMISFGIGKVACKGAFESLMQNNRHFQFVASLVRGEELCNLLLIRATYVPIWIKNYGMAMLEVSWWNFFIAVMICGPPYTLLSVSVGATARDFVDAINTSSTHPLRLAGLFLSLVFTILLAYFFHKQYKRMIMSRASHAARNDGQSLEEGPAPEQHDIGENGAREPSFTTTEPARQPHVY